MKDDQLDDLKQFIDSKVSQSEQRIKSEITSEMATKDDIKRLEQKVDDGFAGVSDAIEAINNTTTDHEQRITKLEQKTA